MPYGVLRVALSSSLNTLWKLMYIIKLSCLALFNDVWLIGLLD